MMSAESVNMRPLTVGKVKWPFARVEVCSHPVTLAQGAHILSLAHLHPLRLQPETPKARP